MARGKKKVELTLEEKLEQALVPVEEQPYEVPGNWCWTRWGIIGEFVAGNGFKNEYQGFTGYEIPFYKVGSLKYADDFGYLYDESNTITEEMRMKLKAKLIPRNSILFAKIGEAIRLNRRCLNKKECCIDNNTMAFLTQGCNFRYVYYWTLGQEFYDLTNATTVPAIRKSDLELIKIPLPPLAEQQRIVEQIESLFDKLDEVSEKVQFVIEQYKEERAAIIHKAYTGELTKCWREKNNIHETWEQLKVEDLCKSLKYGTAKKSKEEGSFIVIRMGNLQGGEIVWNNLAYTDDIEDIEKYKLEKGDVLFNRTNSPEWVGKTSIYRGEYPAIYAGYLIKLDYHRDKVIGDFLNYMLNSPVARKYCNTVKTDGVNQSNINAKKIGAFEIPVLSLEEQKEIVRILDALLKKRKTVLDITEVMLEQIALLKKSILAKAFRGELGTYNPEEESSIELLKNILEETQKVI